MPNGCDGWPDGSWRQCCDIHDIQFSEGGDLLQFLGSNLDLGVCVIQYSNLLNGLLMALGTTLFGGMFFRWKRLNGKNLWEIIKEKFL